MSMGRKPVRNIDSKRFALGQLELTNLVNLTWVATPKRLGEQTRINLAVCCSAAGSQLGN